MNISVCYLLAYRAAEPFAGKMLSMFGLKIEKNILEQIAMLFGMCFFIILNFWDRKYLFSNRRKERITDGKSGVKKTGNSRGLLDNMK